MEEVKSYIDTYRDVIMVKIKVYMNAYYRYYDGDINDAYSEMRTFLSHLFCSDFISESVYKELNKYAYKYAIHYDYSLLKTLVGE